MVVDDLDILRSILPAKADPPLVVDRDRLGIAAVATELLKPIARRHVEVVDAFRRIEHVELTPRDRSNRS
jgi:hypothetical protein